MSTVKAIRERLQMTQEELGKEIGCTQGNVWQMEQGQGLSSRMALALVRLANRKGMRLTLDQVYGLKPLPADEKKVA